MNPEAEYHYGLPRARLAEADPSYWESGTRMEAELEQLFEQVDQAIFQRRSRFKAPNVGSLIKRETSPRGLTLYIHYPLGSEGPAQPMTGIFIPANYRPSPEVNLIVYLHGLKDRCGGSGSKMSIDQYWGPRSEYFKLREGLNATRKNAILVAPTLGLRRPFAGKLTRPGELDAYLNQIMAALKRYGPSQMAERARKVGNIILACHSAGGGPMRDLALARNQYAAQIRECWGFDCLYGGKRDVEGWWNWARSNPNSKLYVHFLNSTAKTSKALRALQGKVPNVKVMPSTALGHCSVPREHWQARLRAARSL